MDMFGKNRELFDTEKTNKNYLAQWSCGDFDLEMSLNDIVNDMHMTDNDHIEAPLSAKPVIEYMGYTAQADSNKIVDVYKAANEVYAQAAADGDWHYFVEGFEPISEPYTNGRRVYSMITGS